LAGLDRFTISGKVILVLRDKDGNIKAVREATNMKVYGTFNIIASAVCNDPATNLTANKLALGSGQTVASSDTALEGESDALSRTIGRFSHDAGAPNWNLSWSVSGKVGTAVVVAQAGIFTSLTGGILYLKTTFATLTVGSTDVLNVAWLQSLASA
jgi:hypothetical protein